MICCLQVGCVAKVPLAVMGATVLAIGSTMLTALVSFSMAHQVFCCRRTPECIQQGPSIGGCASLGLVLLRREQHVVSRSGACSYDMVVAIFGISRVPTFPPGGCCRGRRT